MRFNACTPNCLINGYISNSLLSLFSNGHTMFIKTKDLLTKKRQEKERKKEKEKEEEGRTSANQTIK